MNHLRKYKNIYDQNIILLHKGDLTFDLVSSIISSLEQKVEKLESKRQVVKKFYNVSTEVIQNLYYHIDEVKPETIQVEQDESKSALILIAALKKHFTFQTGNYIQNIKIPRLKERLDEINSKDSKALREMYKKVLSNQMYTTSKGTGGLGFIDIARKSGEKIHYDFFEVNEEVSYFTIEIKLSRL